jgi:hypothetical protein
MSKWEESLQIRYRHYAVTTFPGLLITDYSLLITYPSFSSLPPKKKEAASCETASFYKFQPCIISSLRRWRGC